MRSLLVVVLFAVAVMGCGSSTPVHKHTSATVIEKRYSPAATGTGTGSGFCTGVGVGANGSVSTVSGSCFGTVTLTIPESWALIVKDCNPECEVWAVQVPPLDWADYRPGATVTFKAE